MKIEEKLTRKDHKRNITTLKYKFPHWVGERFKEKNELRKNDGELLKNGKMTEDEYIELKEGSHAETFNLREVAEHFKLNYYDKDDYNRMYYQIAKMRKLFDKYFTMFLESSDYDKLKKMGKRDEDIWAGLIIFLNKANIYILSGDRYGHYRNATMQLYAEGLNNRIFAMNSELKDKYKNIMLIKEKMPKFNGLLKRPEENPQPHYSLLVEYSVPCPYCSCGFSSQSELTPHLIISHGLKPVL